MNQIDRNRGCALRVMALMALLCSSIAFGSDLALSNGEFQLTVSESSGDVISFSPLPGSGDILNGRVGQVYVSDENATETASQMRSGCAATSVSCNQPTSDSIRVVRVTPRGTITSDLVATAKGLEWNVEVSRSSGGIAGASIVWCMPVLQSAEYSFAPYQGSGLKLASSSATYYFNSDTTEYISNPVVGAYDASAGWGVAAFADLSVPVYPKTFDFAAGDAYGSMKIASTNLRIDASNSIVAEDKMIFAGCEGDWRAVLGAVNNAYPEFFSVQNPKAWGFDGIYAQDNYVYNNSVHKYLKENWGVSLSTLQYAHAGYGDYTPASQPWDSAWVKGVWDTFIYNQITSSHRYDIGTIIYYEALLCNQEIADADAELKACAVKDAAGNYRELTVSSWDTYYMALNGNNAWASHQYAELSDLFGKYPEADGIMCDGAGYPWFIYNDDDNATVKDGVAVAYGVTGRKWFIDQIADYLHQNDKVMVMNGSTVNEGDAVDIILAEFSDDRLLTRSYAALNKPIVAWPWPIAASGADLEEDCQTALVAGARIAPPYFAYYNNVSASVRGEFDFMLERYLPLFNQLKGGKWVLEANCYDSPAGVEGNIFYSDTLRQYTVIAVDRSKSVSSAGSVNNVTLTVDVDDAADVFAVKAYSADDASGEATDLTWSRAGNVITISLPLKTASAVAIKLQPRSCDEALRLGYQLPEDIAGEDCRVDLDDYATVAGQWGEDENPDNMPADLGVLFSASYNNTLDADYAKGSEAAYLCDWDGTLQELSADGEGLFSSSSPNKAVVNSADSYYGVDSFLRYDRTKNIDEYNSGTVLFWAKKISEPTNGAELVTFFAASDDDIVSNKFKLAIYTDKNHKNVWARVGDGEGHETTLASLNYYNQMQPGKWTMMALAWDRDASDNLNINFYTRDKQYPVNRSYVSGSIAGWDPNELATGNMYVGTDFGAQFSGPCAVDQLVIYDRPLSEAEIDEMYAATAEFVAPDRPKKSVTFLATYNDGVDPEFSITQSGAMVNGASQSVTADGDGIFLQSSPNKAVENTMDSYYGDPNNLKYERIDNLDTNSGSVIFWAKRTAIPEASPVTTFFDASNAQQHQSGQKLTFYCGDSTAVMNVWALFSDGDPAGQHTGGIKSLNYFNQMKVGDWTFFGATWNYNEATGALDISYYTRDKKYIQNRSYVTGAVANWNPVSAAVNAGDYITVGTGLNGSYSGPCVVDQVAVFDHPLTEDELEALYWEKLELDWKFKDCQQMVDMGYGFAADFDGDCAVGVSDLRMFVAGWLDCNDPEDVNCAPNWE